VPVHGSERLTSLNVRGATLSMLSTARTEVFLLYQMGSTEDWTWYSVIGVFLSEQALRAYADEKVVAPDLKLMTPPEKGDIVLPEPVEFVAVRSPEGAVPGVEPGWIV